MTKEEFITERTRIISEMLDNPDKYGLYPTTRCFTELDLLYDKIILSLKSQLSETQESKSDFINVIKKRIEYFNTKYHKYEGEELQNALDIINRLVPPNEFAKAGEEKPIIKKCRQCRFFDLDEHCEPCESCYPIAYSNWQPR